jgi:hypothetical protein
VRRRPNGDHRPGAARLDPTRYSSPSSLVAFALLAALAVWSAAWVLRATSAGIEFNQDAGYYLGVAANLRHGHGPSTPVPKLDDDLTPREQDRLAGHVPSTHFPPGYPVVIAATSIIAGSVRGAARVVDVVLAPVNLVLLALLTLRMTGRRSIAVGLVPPLLIVAIREPVFFDVSTGWWALQLSSNAEPMCTACISGALLLLGRYFSTASHRRMSLVGAVGLAAFAFATRYVAIAIVIVVAAALVVVNDGDPLRRRIRRAATATFAMVAPLLAFLLWAAASGGGTPRSITYHPQPGTRHALLTQVGGWAFDALLGGNARDLAVIALVLFVAAASVWLARNAPWREDREGNLLFALTAATVVTYLVVLIITRTWLDISTPINARLLIPVRGLFYVLVVAVAYRVLSVWLRAGVTAAVVIALAAVPVTHEWHSQRGFFAAARAHALVATALERKAASAPEGTVVAANSPIRLYAGTGRGSITLPVRRNVTSGRANGRFGLEVRELAALLRSRAGYVLVQPGLPSSFPAVTISELRQFVPLRLVGREGDEELYAAGG